MELSASGEAANMEVAVLLGLTGQQAPEPLRSRVGRYGQRRWSFWGCEMALTVSGSACPRSPAGPAWSPRPAFAAILCRSNTRLRG